MTELKITATQTREHYHVEYECGCYRNALNGGISSMICKEGHIYSGSMIKLECRCWDAYGGPRWCENHLKFHYLKNLALDFTIETPFKCLTMISHPNLLIQMLVNRIAGRVVSPVFIRNL